MRIRQRTRRRVIPMLDVMLVCLDLTDIDDQLIDYAVSLAGKTGSSRIIFTHVIQAYDLGETNDTGLGELQEKVRLQLERRINRLVTGPVHTLVTVEIEHEDVSRRVIDMSRQQKADLVVMGKKHGSNRDLRYEKQITEAAYGNVLIIPEGSRSGEDHILCALDFSEASKKAFTLALQMHKKTDGRLSCYYLYDTGSSFFPTSTIKSSASFEQRLRRQVKSFLSAFDLHIEDVPCRIEIDDTGSLSHAERMRSISASLIIVGARGDVSKETSVLGNTIENLRHTDYRVPVMIVRNQ
jgi:nucleotide-binding universal stress UspA family protein